MIDPTFATVIIGFVLLIITVLWSDRKHDRRLSAIETELVEVKVELRAQSERLERQEQRLDQHDQRFDQHDQRFDRIDERFEQQSTEINAVGRKVDRVEGMVYVLIHGPEYRGRGMAPELDPEEEMSEPVND